LALLLLEQKSGKEEARKKFVEREVKHFQKMRENRRAGEGHPQEQAEMPFPAHTDPRTPSKSSLYPSSSTKPSP